METIHNINFKLTRTKSSFFIHLLKFFYLCAIKCDNTNLFIFGASTMRKIFFISFRCSKNFKNLFNSFQFCLVHWRVSNLFLFTIDIYPNSVYVRFDKWHIIKSMISTSSIAPFIAILAIHSFLYTTFQTTFNIVFIKMSNAIHNLLMHTILGVKG